MFDIILAIDLNNGLGLNKTIPWHLPQDLNLFNTKTQNSSIIIGRKTLESLPKINLTNRNLITISSLKKENIVSKNEYKLCSSFEEALEEAEKYDRHSYIAGGAQLFEYIIKKHYERINIFHLSVINDVYDCDTYLPSFNHLFLIQSLIQYDNFIHYELIKCSSEYGENQYIQLIRDVLSEGERRVCRNGVTISSFGKNLKFDLRNGFPLLTTKKMFTRGIIEELLFFIRGDTNSKILEEKGINIWKGNTSREFLDSIDMKDREEGDMGPMYGYQWRHFNANNDNRGIDQLRNVVDLIKRDPTSRRILMTDYNPEQAHLGVLFPCHSIIIQFYVQNEYLDMYCFNRSSDLGLGLPFNIASSSLLLMLVSKLTNLNPRYFILSLGDSHIYEEHIEAINEQIKRIPYSFPHLRLPDINDLCDIDNLNASDFELINYQSHNKVLMDMKP